MQQIWHFTNQIHAHSQVLPQPNQSINSPCPSLCVLLPISKEQMGVLHVHPPLPSVKTNSKYLWPPVHSPSLTLQYPPFTSAYSFLHAPVLPFLATHSYFPKQTIFRISQQSLTFKIDFQPHPHVSATDVPSAFHLQSSLKFPPFPSFSSLHSDLHSKSLHEIQSQFLVPIYFWSVCYRHSPSHNFTLLQLP